MPLPLLALLGLAGAGLSGYEIFRGAQKRDPKKIALGAAGFFPLGRAARFAKEGVHLFPGAVGRAPTIATGISKPIHHAFSERSTYKTAEALGEDVINPFIKRAINSDTYGLRNYSGDTRKKALLAWTNAVDAQGMRNTGSQMIKPKFFPQEYGHYPDFGIKVRGGGSFPVQRTNPPEPKFPSGPLAISPIEKMQKAREHYRRGLITKEELDDRLREITREFPELDPGLKGPKFGDLPPDSPFKNLRDTGYGNIRGRSELMRGLGGNTLGPLISSNSKEKLLRVLMEGNLNKLLKQLEDQTFYSPN